MSRLKAEEYVDGGIAGKGKPPFLGSGNIQSCNLNLEGEYSRLHPRHSARMKTDDIIKAFIAMEEKVFDLWQNKNFPEKCHEQSIKLGYQIPRRKEGDDHE